MPSGENRGERVGDDPPVVSAETRLNPIQAHLFAASFLAYTTDRAAGTARVPAPRLSSPSDWLLTAAYAQGAPPADRRFTSFWRGFNQQRGNFALNVLSNAHREFARQDVGGAACGERHDDLDRTRRIGALGADRGRVQGGGQRAGAAPPAGALRVRPGRAAGPRVRKASPRARDPRCPGELRGPRQTGLMQVRGADLIRDEMLALLADLPFGWQVSGGYEREDASQLDQRFEGKYARADVTMPIGPTVALLGGVGYEDIEIGQRNPVVDTNGLPVRDANGRFITDKSTPRQLSFDTDGLIWDAGVMWQPSRRTSLTARVGRRYGDTIYTGSFSYRADHATTVQVGVYDGLSSLCLLYTSDAADERSSVALGGRRIIKKKNNIHVSDIGMHNRSTHTN